MRPDMLIDDTDQHLLAAIADGLPLTPRPYADIGAGLALDESQVLSRLRRLIDQGIIKRFGVIVRHHELGYRANAMCVWDIEDDQVDATGSRLAAYDSVTLCYQRPRRLPDWPYNLFCMIHGRHRDEVLAEVVRINRETGLNAYASDVLFSTRRFKQRGARYGGGDRDRLRGAA